MKEWSNYERMWGENAEKKGRERAVGEGSKRYVTHMHMKSLVTFDALPSLHPLLRSFSFYLHSPLGLVFELGPKS